MELKEKLARSSDNKDVISLLELEKYIDSLKPWSDHGYDEGAQVFFNIFGEEVPKSAKYSMGIYNVMINPNSGLIFAVQIGRFTFIVRPSFRALGMKSIDSLSKATTLDGEIDVTGLGRAWAILSCVAEEDEEYECIWAAYRQSET